MADTISYIKVGDENHPIDAITVNGITLTSAEKTLWNNKQDALTFDSIPTENSGNPITSGGIYTVIKDNEYVIAAAINDINTRLTNVESGGGSGSGSGITSESDPVFASSPAAGITAADISNWRSMSSGSGITSESDPVFAASVAASITASDISNWNSKTSNTGTLTGVKFNGTNATVSNGVASISVTIPAAQVQSDWNATTGVSAIKNKPTIPAAVTEATVSGWGFTKNTGTLTGVSMNGAAVSVSNGIANLGTVLTSHQSIKTINGNTITGTGNVTIPALPEATSSDMGKLLVCSYNSIDGYCWEKTGDVTLYSDGILVLPGSQGTTYINTFGIFRSDRASWDWIKTGTGATGGTQRTLQSDLDAIRQLPAVSSTDNGKILQVVNGQWTLVSPVNIYSGNGSPNNSQGDNGDLYLQTS